MMSVLMMPMRSAMAVMMRCCSRLSSSPSPSHIRPHASHRSRKSHHHLRRTLVSGTPMTMTRTTTLVKLPLVLLLVLLLLPHVATLVAAKRISKTFPPQPFEDPRRPPRRFVLPQLARPVPIVAVDHVFFIDALGRRRIVRGTNVVYKGPPWIPDTSPHADPMFSFNQLDVNLLASHGVTAVRLGVMWPGVEAVRGVYDYDYLSEVKKIVRMCERAGIMILLDFHQDGLSEKFCGEGVPLWAAQPDGPGYPVPIEKEPYTDVDDRGVPTKYMCRKHFYSETLFSYAVSSSYQRLFDNYDGLRDAFVEYWKLVARTFTETKFSNILGYDLINEPWAGDINKNPTLLLPGVADFVNLQGFYDIIADGIRTVDPEAIIFFEPVTWDNPQVGFRHVPGGKSFGNKSVLSFHYYKQVNIVDLPVTLRQRSLDMRRLGCGGAMTEYEMGHRNGTNIESIRQTSKASDDLFFSWMGWEYQDYIEVTGTNNGIKDPETGEVRPDMAEVLSRTYATAITGIPTSMSFNDNTGHFRLRFVHDGSEHPTEIRVTPHWHYPEGYIVRAYLGADDGDGDGDGGGGDGDKDDEERDTDPLKIVGGEEGSSPGFVFVVGGPEVEGKEVVVEILRRRKDGRLVFQE